MFKDSGDRQHGTTGLLHGAAFVYAIKIAGAGLQFGLYFLLIGILGAEGFGGFMIAFTLVQFASIFGRIGMDQAMVKLVAVSAANRDWGQVRETVRRGFACVLAAGICSAALLFLISGPLSSSVFGKPHLSGTIKVISLAVVPFSVMMLVTESLRGYKNVVASQFVQVVVLNGAAVAATWLLGRHYGVNGAALGYALAAAVAMFTAILLWRAATPQVRSAPHSPPVEPIFGVSFPLMWVNSMFVINGWVSTLMLGIFVTDSEVGIFSAAQRVSMLITLVLIAVNSMSAPRFAALYHGGDLSRLSEVVRHSTRYMLLASTPIILLCVAFPGALLGLFGAEFTAAATELRILAVAQFINVGTGSVSQLLAMTGHQRVLRNIITSSAVINTVMCLLLIPKYGILGAALSTATMVIYISIVAAWQVSRLLKVDAHILAFLRKPCIAVN